MGVAKRHSTYAAQVYTDFQQPWLQQLMELRHTGVSGHGFIHYKKEEIEAICEGSPLKRIEELLCAYEIKAPCDFFALIQKAILALVRQQLQPTIATN